MLRRSELGDVLVIAIIAAAVGVGAALWLKVNAGAVHAGMGLVDCDDCHEDIGALKRGIEGYLLKRYIGDDAGADAELREGIKGAKWRCQMIDVRVAPDDPPDPRMECRPL